MECDTKSVNIKKKECSGEMYRILIVDEERIERNGIRFLLKKLNMEFDIDEAVNGLDAL